jgi:hypothetical protein
MTQDQRRRVVEALAETNRLLEKEMRYSPHLRKLDQIAFYGRHIVKLAGYLETDTMPTDFVRS